MVNLGHVTWRFCKKVTTLLEVRGDFSLVTFVCVCHSVSNGCCELFGHGVKCREVLCALNMVEDLYMNTACLLPSRDTKNKALSCDMNTSPLLTPTSQKAFECRMCVLLSSILQGCFHIGQTLMCRKEYTGTFFHSSEQRRGKESNAMPCGPPPMLSTNCYYIRCTEGWHFCLYPVGPMVVNPSMKHYSIKGHAESKLKTLG